MKKVLALIAHDAKKDDMIQLVKAHKEELAGIELIATLDTGQRIRERTGLAVNLLLSGPLGGEMQIG
ncbi:MAG: methylglyoxal synthase, partial [Dehalococcoidales bacterium]